MQARIFNANAVAILILALGVRLLGVASQPISYDEAFSLIFSEKGLSSMPYGALAPSGTGSADIHRPGYYTLLWLWMKVFGESIVAAYLPSILAGLVSVYLVHLVASEIVGHTKTPLMSRLFMAFAPFQVHCSQEFRMSSFLSMCIPSGIGLFQHVTWPAS
jgi:4-amino-4-deoxy-L-arabinose transferase-like glycosyltransferase